MGYEFIVGDPEWCHEVDAKFGRLDDTCRVPLRTAFEGADPVVGLGSVWRCDKCGRRWMLVKHEREETKEYLRELQGKDRELRERFTLLPSSAPLTRPFEDWANWLPVE